MPEYRRFISYIYEYQSGKKGKNCGYAKVELRNGACRLRLHLQELSRTAGALKVHAFVRSREETRGILLGSAAPVNGALDFQVSTPAAAVGGTEYSMEDVRGIWLRGEQQENYITVWDDEPVAVEGFTPAAPDRVADSIGAADTVGTIGVADTIDKVGAAGVENAVNAAGAADVAGVADVAGAAGSSSAVDTVGAAGVENAVNAAGAGNADGVADVTGAGMVGAENAVNLAGAEETKGEISGAGIDGVSSMPGVAGISAAGAASGDGCGPSDAEKLPAQQPETQTQQLGILAQQPEEPSGSLWSRWDSFLRHYPQIRPFADEEIVQCIAITPKDISYLQRAEWQFIRNTFVRQAYMRYHHLVLGCHRSGRFVFAVPGADDSQERHMARMHGFLYYKEANGDTAQSQGYWYRFLDEKWPC